MSILPIGLTSKPRGHSLHAALLVMLVALCLGLSACSGGGDDSGGDPHPVFGDDDDGGGGTPQPSGDDHSDRPERATRIYPGDNVSGRLTHRDLDYFRITLNQPGRLLIYTSGGLDTRGRLLTSEHRFLVEDDDGGEGNNFRIERNVTSGTYLIQLGGVGGEQRGSYTLHVRFSAASSGGGGTPRGDDHGNTRADATGIALDTNSSIEITTDGELTAGDTDYFRIILDRPGTLRLHTSGGTDTYGHLENSGGGELTRNDDGGSGRNFRIERSLSAGTYYVRVRGFSGSTSGRYTLHVRFTQDMLQGASGDVRVNLTWRGDVDLDLFVTNPCVQTLGYREGDMNTCDGFVGEWDHDDTGSGSGSDNPNAENIVWTNGAPSGRYIVRITYFNGTVPVDYTIRVFYGSRQRTYTGRLDPANDHQIRRHVANFDFAGSTSSHGAEASRFDKGSQALSQAARTLGMSAVEAMGSRGQGPEGSSVTLAGQPVSFGNGAATPDFSPDDPSFAKGGPDWMDRERADRSGSWSEFLRGSRFDVALDGETRVWGEARGVEGGNETRFLGFERSFGEGVSAGVAFSDTANEGNFGLGESESLEASLASAYQYLHFSPGASTELWSLVGAGEGELSLTDDLGTVETGLSMQMLAFGSSHGLGPLVAGFAPTVSADGFLVRLESERRAGLRPLAGEASRLRTGVLFQRPSEGDGWTPKIGFGVRHEDDERGEATRTEVMAGFGYVRGPLQVEGMTYYRPAGAIDAEAAGTDFETRDAGARLTAHYRAGADGRGLAVSVDALAGSVPDAPVWETDKAAGDSSRVHLQAGYGIPWGLGRWTPYGAVQWDDDEQRLREGVRHDIGAVSLDLYGEHRLGAASEHGLHVGVTARY